MTTTHRNFDGDWVECTAPGTCDLLFHVPDLAPQEVNALPEAFLDRLIEAIDPPVRIDRDGTKHWGPDLYSNPHRDYDLPAMVMSDGSRLWYQHGRLHRYGDKPAQVLADGTLIWSANGLDHRGGDLPAAILSDGTLEWYQEGRRHRDGGMPAVVKADGTYLWYERGGFVKGFPEYRQLLEKLAAAQEVDAQHYHPATLPPQVLDHTLLDTRSDAQWIWDGQRLHEQLQLSFNLTTSLQLNHI